MRTYAFDEAVQTLRDAGMEVHPRPDGYSVPLPDSGDLTAHCGIERDGSLSLAVERGEAPVKSFFRPTTVEMTFLLLSAFKLTQTGTKMEWIEALNLADISEGN